jgi:hypothetical protein
LLKSKNANHKIFTQVFLVNMTLEKPHGENQLEEKFYYGDLMQNKNKEIHKKNLIHMLAPLKIGNGVPLEISASLEEMHPSFLAPASLEECALYLVRPLNLALPAFLGVCAQA